MTRTERATRARAQALELVRQEGPSPVLVTTTPDPGGWQRVQGQLKQLSIKDPWIKLIGEGRKRYELRTRATTYRGTVVLCSSATPSRTPDALAARERYKSAGLWTMPPLGAALYLGQLVDCRPATPADEVGACCPPVAGEFAWVFEDVLPLPDSVPMKGMLGLTDCLGPLRARVVEMLKGIV